MCGAPFTCLEGVLQCGRCIMVDGYSKPRILRICREALTAVEEHARKRFGLLPEEAARPFFPVTDLASSAVASMLRPWSLFRWHPRRESINGLPANGANGLQRLNLAESFLQSREGAASEAVLSFVRAARRTPFRFLVVNGREGGEPVLLDSLHERDLRVAWPENLPQPGPHAVVFGHVVELEGWAAFTHTPVATRYCNAGAEELRRFFDLLAKALRDWHAAGLGGEDSAMQTIVENTLLHHAAAVATDSPDPCPDAMDSPRTFRLELSWPDGEPAPDGERLPHHLPWAKVTKEHDSLILQAPGLLPAFAAFRHLLFATPQLSLRSLTLA